MEIHIFLFYADINKGSVKRRHNNKLGKVNLKINGIV